MNNIIKAIEYATEKHLGAVRKINNHPYVTHPIIVSEMCREFTNDEDTIIAAILHDVPEDTDATLDDIEEIFGSEVAYIVKYCTEVSGEMKGVPRKERKKLDREHYCKGSNKSKLIKIMDAIHNCSSMVISQPDFARTYIYEKQLMVDEMLKSLNDSNEEPKLICAVRRFHSMYSGWLGILNIQSDEGLALPII